MILSPLLDRMLDQKLRIFYAKKLNSGNLVEPLLQWSFKFLITNIIIVFQPNSRLLLLPLLGLLLTSCESKVAQCQKIVKIHNQIVVDTQKVTNSGTKGDIKAVLKSAEVFAKGAQDMAAIEVSDQKLQEIKNQFTTMYQNSSQVVQQIVDSQNKKKNADVAKGLANLSQVASPEKNLVDGINSYCQEGQASAGLSSPNSDKK